MSRKELCKFVERKGWVRVKSKGHLQYKHPTIPGRVTIPHKITKNIEHSIRKQMKNNPS